MSQPARGCGAPSICLLGLLLVIGRPALTADTSNWSCVRDNVTGLTWEVKTDDGGLRDRYNTYSWYNPDAASNGGSAGTQNGGTCTGGIACDTASYVRAVNAQRLCGASDWRLPSRRELLSIVSNDRLNPAIDLAYFSDSPLHQVYWSASPYANPNYAWYVDFSSGYSFGDGKDAAWSVRLVRGGQ